MSMIERVAKAIYEEDDPWHKAWPWPNLNESQGSPEPYRRIAAAAIKTMREPTESMTCAGFDAAMGEISDDFDRIEVQSSIGRTVWHRMIDAALVGEG
jgi:hypothetical protein